MPAPKNHGLQGPNRVVEASCSILRSAEPTATYHSRQGTVNREETDSESPPLAYNGQYRIIYWVDERLGYSGRYPEGRRFYRLHPGRYFRRCHGIPV